MRRNENGWLRLLLWLGVLYTARANQKYFGLPTTWVFHLTLNTFTLCLPEIVRGTGTILQLDARAKQKRDFVTTAHATIEDAVVTNPNYAWYVAPVALAYIVSHPHFNIYKGDWAKVRLFGFGLDALPHSSTAFAFTQLVMDTLSAFRKHTPRDASWRALAVMADKHAGNLAGAFLIGASALYETGEYAINQEELRETGGDESKINLVWSAEDTLFDLMSNTLGWLTAVLVRRKHTRRAVGDARTVRNGRARQSPELRR